MLDNTKIQEVSIMEMIKKSVSGRDFESLKTILKDAISKEGFSILSEYDFKKILTSKGMKCAGDAYVIDMCNPSNAERILSSEMSLGINLPCKIGIFEEKGGYSVIYPNPVSIIKTEDSTVQNSLNEISDVLKRIVTALE